MWEQVKKWLPRLILGLAALGLIWELGRASLLYLEYNWKTVTFPYSVDYGEGPILDQVMRMAKLQNIYRPNPTEIPYTISNYPPSICSFKHLLPGSLALLTGMGAVYHF